MGKCKNNRMHIVRSIKRMFKISLFWLLTILVLILVAEAAMGFLYGFLPLPKLPQGYHQFYERPFIPPFETLNKNNTCFFKTTTATPEMFEIPKPANIFRIVILGGSFAEQLGNMPTLRKELDKHFPAYRFEVVNLATGGYDSQRVKITAQHAKLCNPDLVIIASGNNENLHPQCSLNPKLHKLKRQLGRSRLFVFLQKTIQTLSPLLSTKKTAGDFFHQNIEQTIKLLKHQNIKTSLVVLCPNYRHWQTEPDKPCTNPEHIAARLFMAWGKHEKALKKLSNISNDPSMSNVYFDRAVCLDRLGNNEQAFEYYQKAVDSSPMRVTSSIQHATKQVAAQYNLVTFDLKKYFRQYSPQHIPGMEIFFDNCHVFSERKKDINTFMADIITQNSKKFGLPASKIITTTSNTELQFELTPFMKKKQIGTISGAICHMINTETFGDLTQNDYWLDFLYAMDPTNFTENAEIIWTFITGEIPPEKTSKTQPLFAAKIAHILIKNSNWTAAGPYLQQALKATPPSIQTLLDQIVYKNFSTPIKQIDKSRFSRENKQRLNKLVHVYSTALGQIKS